MRKASKQPRNWIDTQLVNVSGQGSFATVSSLLTGISAGGTGPGRCTGRVVHLESVELRLSLTYDDPGGAVSSALIINPGNTGVAIAPAEWAGGNGPTAPITYGLPPTVLPYPLFAGYCPPFRVILFFDLRPFTSPFGPTAGDLLDYSVLFGYSAGGVVPFREDNKDRFLVFHDEVVNPKQMPVYNYTRKFDLEEILGLRPTQVMLLDNVTNAGAITSGAIFMLLTSDNSTVMYPQVEKGSSRVYYYDD